jgi:peroxiredoxin Q/BCP
LEGALVTEGELAPDFALESDTGETVTLSSFRGQKVVLYFYPKDSTPGCTKQACGFRDALSEYQERGAVVLGVSPDDAASHRKFKERYELPFTLLVDSEHEVAEAYGAWGEKSFAGRNYMGVIRSTFVIDPDGTVAQTMYGVNAERNPTEVLEAL